MAFSKKGTVPGGRRIFRPLYLLIIWGILGALLIINGIYEAKRVKDNLYHMLFDEGSALVEGMEKSAQSNFTALAAIGAFAEPSAFMISSPINLLALEEAVVDLVVETAFQIDKQLGNRPPEEGELRKIAERTHLSRVELITASRHLVYDRHPDSTLPERGTPFYQPILEGKKSYAVRRSEKKGSGQMENLSIAVSRKAGEGILVLRADEAEIQSFRKRIILQGLIDEWEEKGETKYIVFQAEDAEVLADTNEEKIGKREDVPFVQELFLKTTGTPKAQAQRKPGILEVAKVITLGKNSRAVLRVGLSTEKAKQIIDADRRNILLFSLLLLVSGGTAVTFLYRMENRHLARIRAMEEKVHQSEKMSSLANLAAGVAHEIRNPLNAIGMVIQRLQREFAPERPELQEGYQRFTELLRGEVKRVNEIIEQFLFFARPARLDLQPVQVNEILKDLLLLCQETAEQQKVAVEAHLSPGLPNLHLDRKRMQEALWNLVSNGIQAMPLGGRLYLSTKNHEGREVLIQITDTGEGIPEQNLGKVFDYYFTTKEKGVGLGLPIAHKIIQDHGGSIEVQSAVGRGTTFRVHLPLSMGEG